MNNFTVSSPSPVTLFDAVKLLSGSFALVSVGYLPGPPILFEAQFAPKGDSSGMTKSELADGIAKLDAYGKVLKKNASPSK